MKRERFNDLRGEYTEETQERLENNHIYRILMLQN